MSEVDETRIELARLRAVKIRIETHLTDLDARIDEAEKALFDAEEADWGRR